MDDEVQIVLSILNKEAIMAGQWNKSWLERRQFYVKKLNITKQFFVSIGIQVKHDVDSVTGRIDFIFKKLFLLLQNN